MIVAALGVSMPFLRHKEIESKVDSRPSPDVQRNENFVSKIDPKDSKSIESVAASSDGELIDVEKPMNMSASDWSFMVNNHKRFAADNMPINFYGVIVDQQDIPVEGAKVQIKISAYDPSFSAQLTSEGMKTLETVIEVESDKNGMFSIRNEYGRTLRVLSISKSGYEALKSFRSGYSYGKSIGDKHQANESDPVRFKLWKASEPAELIKIDMEIDISESSGPVYLDLKSGDTFSVQNGSSDLELRMNFIEKQQSNRYGWGIVIKVLDGGIALSDGFLFEAPEDGYLSSIDFLFEPESKQWTQRINKRMFVRSREGKLYAGLVFTFYAYHTGNGKAMLKGFFNPNGSRNLQPQKQ